MTTTVDKNTIENLRQQAAQAQAQERALAVEADELPTKINEAMREIAQRKAGAARSGEAVATAAEDLDVRGLRERRDELPFERWAAALHTAQLEYDLADAQYEIAVEDEKAAEPKLMQAQRDFDQAKADLEAARGAVNGAAGRQSRYSLLRRDAREKLKELEGNPPNA